MLEDRVHTLADTVIYQLLHACLSCMRRTTSLATQGLISKLCQTKRFFHLRDLLERIYRDELPISFKEWEGLLLLQNSLLMHCCTDTE